MVNSNSPHFQLHSFPLVTTRAYVPLSFALLRVKIPRELNRQSRAPFQQHHITRHQSS